MRNLNGIMNLIRNYRKKTALNLSRGGPQHASQ